MDLCMVYKFCNGLVHLEGDLCDFFELCDSRIHGHSCRLRIPHCRLDVRANFFSQRVLIPWNSLPDSVISSPSLNAFKCQLATCDQLLLAFCSFDRNL